MTPRGFFVGLTSVTLSLAINSAAFVGVGRSFEPLPSKHMTFMQRFLQPPPKHEKGALDFEYVEAPPTPAVHPNAKTRRISTHDAVNSDQKGGGAEGAGPAAKLGSADQLAQRRGKMVPPPSLGTQARRASRAIERTDETVAKEAVSKPKASAASPAVAEAKATELAKTGLSAASSEAKTSDNDIFVPKPAARPSPPQMPSPSTPMVPPQLSGNARINTQEMSRVRSSGARLRGITSFEATGSGMGEYMKDLKERIWLQWFPYLSFKYPFDGQPAAAVISFTIDAKGEVTMVRVVESQGSPLFASFCMEAVQRASPFKPLPKELLDLIGKDYLEIKFGFHFL